MSTKSSSAARDQVWHRLTLVTLGLTALVSLFYLAAFLSPSLLSGFPLTDRTTPTRAVVLSLPSPTVTPIASATPAPSWTPLPTRTQRPTQTPRNTPTLGHTADPTPTFPPTWTPVPTVGPPPPTRSNYPFALQNNEIIFTQYFGSAGCKWLGIAGLVLDKDENPIVGLPIVLNGGGLQNIVTYSGNAPDYGESGWEHFLDARVKVGDFEIQLWDEGRPVSELVQVQTRADCRSNLAYLVFEVAWDNYIPYLRRLPGRISSSGARRTRNGQDLAGIAVSHVQYLMHGATRCNEPGLLISFEEFPQSLHRDANSLGWDLAQLEKEGKLYLLFTSAEVLLKSLQIPTSPLNRMLLENEIRRVVVDSVTHFRRLSDDTQGLRNIFNTLINAFKREGMTSLLIGEETRADYARQDRGRLSFVVDVIILLRHIEIDSAIQRAILVLKMRGSDHIKEIRRYEIQRGGLKITGLFEGREAILSGIPHRVGADFSHR
jgi:circadian clock protein KaiC